MINQPTQPGIPTSRAWKFLLISILILTIFFRFANLDQKVYSADEVRKILRFSGYSSQEFIDRVFTGDIVSVEEIQKYQHPTPERNLTDAINALEGNAEHPPLYQLLARFWMQMVKVTTSARIFSVLLSLLAFPCLYWLCHELFESPITAWVAIPLIAISPFHILAAQNTTQYSLWTVAILLSSGALLKALRVNDKGSWIIYTATLAMGFYTHLFFALGAFGQGIYVIIIERWRFSQRLIAYGLASLAGLLAFTPWIVVIFTNLDKINKNTTYYRIAKTNLPEIISKFNYNLGNMFIDFHNITKLEKYCDYVTLALVAYSIYFLIRHTSMKVWLFILLLIVVTPILIITPDVVGQGIRSHQARYFIPCFLGIQLAVAYLISHNLSLISSNVWQKRFWQFIFIGLLSVGVISGIFITQVKDWGLDDQKGTASSVNLQLAPVINKAKQPLVMSETTHSFVLALSYIVEPKVRFQLGKPNDIEEWQKKINLSENMANFSDVFLYLPDEEFLTFINQDPNFESKVVVSSKDGKNKWLYKIVKK